MLTVCGDLGGGQAVVPQLLEVEVGEIIEGIPIVDVLGRVFSLWVVSDSASGSWVTKVGGIILDLGVGGCNGSR